MCKAICSSCFNTHSGQILYMKCVSYPQGFTNKVQTLILTYNPKQQGSSYVWKWSGKTSVYQTHKGSKDSVPKLTLTYGLMTGADKITLPDTWDTVSASLLYAWLVGTYYCMARASVRPSVCLSVGMSTKLVNTIQTEPFQLGPSNLVHILLMTRGQTLLIFKVRGQRSRSCARHCC